MNDILPSQCTCETTTAGTGLFAECQEALPLGKSVGVRVEIEPCEDRAYAALSYRLLGDWEFVARARADGTPVMFQIPGLTFFGAGLYLDVRLHGDLSDLSVHVLLSVCTSSDSCNGEAASAFGFPLSVVEFDQVGFENYCPVAASDNNIIIIAGAAGGAVVLMALAVLMICRMKKTRNAAKNTNAAGIVMTSVNGPGAKQTDKV